MFRLIKRLFYLVIIVIIIRAFFYEAPFYQDNIAPITEPVFEYFAEQFNDFIESSSSELAQNNEAETKPEKDNSNNHTQNTEESTAQTLNVKEGTTVYDSLYPCRANFSYIARDKRWSDYEGNRFKGEFSISTKQACKADHNRENMPHPSDIQTYWSRVYAQLVETDYEKMPEIYETFEQIGKDKKLNYAEFAKMVVTFIQEIPYVLVHPGTCEEDVNRGGFSVQYHQSGKECLPSKKFGLQSPSEFMYNFKGDCDTRAVFAYAVLSHFGYDVVVFGSPRHAMLGINLPAQGHYLLYGGKKYYFWETTGKGWVSGVIPPEYQNDEWAFSLLSRKAP